LLAQPISGNGFQVKAGGDGKQTLGHIIPMFAITGQPFVKTLTFTFEQ
jgi:hypothetical protein